MEPLQEERALTKSGWDRVRREKLVIYTVSNELHTTHDR
jgi:hypothetical protein